MSTLDPWFRFPVDSVMENRIELIEQWMGNTEASMEQMRQLVLEQQSRPQVTVDQIRQLMQEHGTRRHRRQGSCDRDTIIITLTRETEFLEEGDS